MSPQDTRVLKHLQKHGTVTAFIALQKLGVMSLSSRISELRKAGYPVGGVLVKRKNRFNEVCHVKEYYLTTLKPKGICR